MKKASNLDTIHFYFPTKAIFKENAINEVGSEAI